MTVFFIIMVSKLSSLTPLVIYWSLESDVKCQPGCIFSQVLASSEGHIEGWLMEPVGIEKLFPSRSELSHKCPLCLQVVYTLVSRSPQSYYSWYDCKELWKDHELLNQIFQSQNLVLWLSSFIILNNSLQFLPLWNGKMVPTFKGCNYYYD